MCSLLNIETMLKGMANKEANEVINRGPANNDCALSFEVLSKRNKEIGKTTAVNKAI